MADLIFNRLNDTDIFTDVGSPTAVADSINVNCDLSAQLDGVIDRKTTTQTPMQAGDNAFSGEVTIKRLSPSNPEFIITQKDSNTITGDSIWELTVQGTGANQNVALAYRENVNSTFLFAQTSNGTYPNDTDEHVIGFSIDITNRLIFITIDGVKPSHTFENLVGGSPSATAQGTMHNLSVGSRFSASFTQGLDGVIGRIHMFVNQFLSVDNHLSNFNIEQGLIGTDPDCLPPVLENPIPDQITIEDEVFDFIFAENTFSNPEGDEILYESTLANDDPLPSWLTFTPTTRRFVGTPLQADVGQIEIKVLAFNDVTPEPEKTPDTFFLDVINVSDPPTVDQGIDDQNITVDQDFNFQFPSDAFNDGDGDTLTYIATLENDDLLPGWLLFDSSTRTFSGVPGPDDIENFTVKVIAEDGN